jgi:hypothetical protein
MFIFCKFFSGIRKEPMECDIKKAENLQTGGVCMHSSAGLRERAGKTMKKNGRREKDALISGICFVIYAALLFIIGFLTIFSYHMAVNSFQLDTSGDYISGWSNLFGIFSMVVMAAEAALAIGVIIFAAIYLILGIFIIRGKPISGIAIVSFVLSAVYLRLWFSLSSADVGTGAINPVAIAGTVFFGILALILCSKNFSSDKWVVRKYWMLPSILMAASLLFLPLKYIFLRLVGQTPYPINVESYLIYLPRILLLFSAYFYGSRWMKKKAEADLENLDVDDDQSYYENDPGQR